MDDHMETGWGSFFFWAKKFLDMPTFDKEERVYKKKAAERLARARESLLSSHEWLPSVRSAFSNPDNNIVIRFAWWPFLEWLESSPEDGRAALEALWIDDGSPVGMRLDRFSQVLPDAVLSGRGVRLNVAAYLLGAIDYVEWPNYRVTVVERACELTRVPKAEKELSLGDTYEHALAFFDVMQVEAGSFDLALRDRLDAQSLAFCVTLWRERPTGVGEINEDDWNGLLEYRTVPSKLRQAIANRSQRKAPRTIFVPNHALCPIWGSRTTWSGSDLSGKAGGNSSARGDLTIRTHTRLRLEVLDSTDGSFYGGHASKEARRRPPRLDCHRVIHPQ